MSSVACDRVDGRVYVMARGDSTLRRIDPVTGVVELVADGFGSVNMCNLDLDDAARKLWLADSTASRVYGFCLSPGASVGAAMAGAGHTTRDGLVSGVSISPNPTRSAGARGSRWTSSKRVRIPTPRA